MNKLTAAFKIAEGSTYEPHILTTEDNIHIVDMGEYFSVEVFSADSPQEVVARAFVLRHSLLYLLLENDGN